MYVPSPRDKLPYQTYYCMNTWIINTILCLLLCMLFAGYMIPKILLISFRKRLFDKVDERKIHQGVVPRLGGLAFLPVIMFTISLLVGVNTLAGLFDIVNFISTEIVFLAFFICAAMLIYVTGIADDLIGIRYSAKFVVQIMAGVLLICGGLSISDLYGLFGIHHLSVWIAYPLTVLVTIFIINALNLIDGIDGLASGLSSVATLFYGTVFFMEGYYFFSILSIATLGVLIPFFYYNVFGKAEHHRKIFMGDTGSLTIGLVLAILSIKMLQIGGSVTKIDCNPFILAFAPLILPCFDVVRVFFHRIKNGKSPFLPDNNHIHHKFLRLGFSQHRTMILIILISAALITVNVFCSRYINVTLQALLNIIIWTLGHMKLTAVLDERQKQAEENATENVAENTVETNNANQPVSKNNK